MALSPREDFLNEVAGLRRTMRDLVALSALPAIWTGCGLDRMAESLADALLKTLSLELIYIRFTRLSAAGFTEVVQCGPARDNAKSAEAIRQALAPWLGDPFNRTAAIAHPLGEGSLRIASTRFGYGGDAGLMVAGSLRSDFPTEQERLLLSIGANQAAIAIQQKRVEEERLGLLEREREARKEAETLNEVALTLAAELDVQRLVQKVTDAGTALTAAKFGAFFYNAEGNCGTPAFRGE